ncbi:hypothetical protein D9619_007974 [Psilocybe cf. subviscida]|uniref:Uncharacterized protein n=1 Tax=Psilocybe cf. subviscida TaxID=2480587 RepID=A0A8H5ESC6_9AGAR|nr:hypothetical protein D9619_007974 [Psilocybe cf. subviscida]
MDRPPNEPPNGPFLNVRYGLNPPIAFQPGSRRFPAPPTQNPLDIFKPMINLNVFPGVRWVKLDPTGGSNHAMLLFIDGAAPNNGRPSVRAGCGVGFTPKPDIPGVSKAVKNKDLWVMLVDKIEEYEREGIAVQFHLMERRYNKADMAAKRAAAQTEEVPTEFREVYVAAA